jgi:hypothetical protein
MEFYIRMLFYLRCYCAGKKIKRPHHHQKNKMPRTDLSRDEPEDAKGLGLAVALLDGAELRHPGGLVFAEVGGGSRVHVRLLDAEGLELAQPGVHVLFF